MLIPPPLVNGVITDGGSRPNIVPDKASLAFHLRARTVSAVSRLQARVEECFHAAARVTSCSVEITVGSMYSDLRNLSVLNQAWADAMIEQGVPTAPVIKGQDANPHEAATDQGNVSYVCPAMHPMFGIEATEGVHLHMAEFTQAAGTAGAFERCVEAGKGMATTALRIISDESFANAVWKEFEEDVRVREKDA